MFGLRNQTLWHFALKEYHIEHICWDLKPWFGSFPTSSIYRRAGFWGSMPKFHGAFRSSIVNSVIDSGYQYRYFATTEA